MTEQRYIEIFKKYHKRLVYFAKQYIELAYCEDVVSEVFIRFRLIEDEGEGAIKSWLYTSVKNACFNVLRHNKTIIREHSKIQSEYVEEFEPPIETMIIKTEVIQRVIDHVKRLPPARSRIMQLYWFSGLSYDEIATKLNISIDTCRVQVKRGLAALKEMARKEFPDMICNIEKSEVTRQNEERTRARNREREIAALKKASQL